VLQDEREGEVAALTPGDLKAQVRVERAEIVRDGLIRNSPS
jgi:hypothetical protein